MPTKVNCLWFLTVVGNQTQASLAARMAAVPLNLALPQIWGLIPSADAVTLPDGVTVQRAISLDMGNGGSAVITAALDSSPTHGRVHSLTLGATAGFYGAPPIITIAAPPTPGGQRAMGVAVMGLKKVVISNGGAAYTGATTAALVGGNLAPGGVPATLGAVTIIAGAIVNVAVATPGSGYTTYPTVVFADSGGGSGALGYGGLNLVGVTLVNPGYLYTTAPGVVVTPYYPASYPASQSEGTDQTMAMWMTGEFQIALRSPINTDPPGIA